MVNVSGPKPEDPTQSQLSDIEIADRLKKHAAFLAERDGFDAAKHLVRGHVLTIIQADPRLAEAVHRAEVNRQLFRRLGLGISASVELPAPPESAPEPIPTKAEFWHGFKNPALWARIDRINPEQHAYIVRMTEDLIRHCEFFYIDVGKPCGMTAEELGGQYPEHQGRRIKGDPDELRKLKPILTHQYGPLADTLASVVERMGNSLKILNHPTDSTKVILIISLPVPGGTPHGGCLYDNRIVGNAYTLMVDKTALIFRDLKEGRHGRLLPFIFGYTGMRICPQDAYTRAFFDAPIGLEPPQKSNLFVLDYELGSIEHYVGRFEDDPNAERLYPKAGQWFDPDQFIKQLRTWSIPATSLRRYPWY